MPSVCDAVTLDGTVYLCAVYTVSKFSRPYLLTCNAGGTDYINAVFIDVRSFS